MEAKKIPQCAFYKLESQENLWCNSLLVQVLRARGDDYVNSSPGVIDNEMTQLKRLGRFRCKFLLLAPFVLFRSWMNWVVPYPYWEGQSTRSADSNANLIWQYLVVSKIEIAIIGRYLVKINRIL